MKRSEAKMLARVVAQAIRDHAPPQLRYRGQYAATASYAPGHFASHEGNVWHCDAPCHGVAPSVGSEHWTLAVKRGKDGSNG